VSLQEEAQESDHGAFVLRYCCRWYEFLSGVVLNNCQVLKIKPVLCAFVNSIVGVYFAYRPIHSNGF